MCSYKPFDGVIFLLAKVSGVTILGIDGYLVEVEVDVAQGLPNLDIVGLPDAAVREARERVRSAVKNCDLNIPNKRITVNLAPADLRKEGAGFDLAIAVALLAASQQLDEELLRDTAFVGELSLDGTVRPVPGALPMAIACRKAGKRLVLPLANASEAMLVEGLEIIPVTSLTDLLAVLLGHKNPSAVSETEQRAKVHQLDFKDIAGQEQAKRALEVAAAGGHNVLLVGPPGSGKTLMARHLPTILPPMHREEALEVTKIYSVAGLLVERGSLVAERPFRSPHHSISYGGLIGGGRIPQPGEVSLSHHGVLFLDELPEFSKRVLEQLRQPLEDGKVTISRVNATLSYPAEIMLVAAMNPCPCGYLGDKLKPCTCSPGEVSRYQARISGPLLDRIDIQLHVPRLEYDELSARTGGETSATIRARVVAARELQEHNLRDYRIFSNARMQHRHLRKLRLSEGAEKLLKNAFIKLALSARAHDRILKVARTIADLAMSEIIEAVHIAEAISYRTLDRQVQ